ncbi:putative protein phosphatase 2C [Echinococcus granulosus]|uniref:protein-serine/threonine phosphatase n=1 Tax=Echinococcus granulosus TaxID=6210 RepID=W6UPR9_ECHGR|nr:putative protein phosphatase 2C [Echinococcus granulosus]EUB63253.1 putative protein phosphatase 2C [Echinococcus granulosus]
MGQLISGPVTFKETKVWRNSQFSVAASSMQGWRVRMEDAYACFLDLSTSDMSSPPTAYFAVFDGHGGNKVSEYAATNLHAKIMAEPAYGNKNSRSQPMARCFLTINLFNLLSAKGDLVEAMRSGVLKLDAEMQVKFTGHLFNSGTAKASFDSSEIEVEGRLSFPSPSDGVDVGGSTCIALMLRGNHAYCANCGDSRAVLSRQGVAEPLSVDHKPTMASEWSRIVAAGGWVAANRVNGNLALSRALGDFVYKRNSTLSAEEQIVSAEPDITQCELKVTETDEFIVLGCDGIWDVMTNQEVISFVRSRLANGRSPDLICEELMMHCLAPNCNPNGLGCDNMTVVIICLLNGGTYEDLKQRCSRLCPAGLAVDVLSP